MALHRGRMDLIERHLANDPGLLRRRFALDEVYPLALGMEAHDALTSTPLDGATLLHLAAEYDDVNSAAWLLDHGADPNARTGDPAGSGHSPLFHAVVSMGRKSASMARLLLDHGAEPDLPATLRKQLRDMGDPAKEEPRVYSEVTAREYGLNYVEPSWVNEPALALLRSPQP